MKIGLTLGGGGSRGLAHIGVLKVLRDLNLPIAAIAGCSAGAVIGAFLAAGKSVEEMESFALKHNFIDFLDWSITKRGFDKTNKLEKRVMGFLNITSFKDLKIPLYINATNISSGKEKIFKRGDLFTAIRASMSIPGIFAPAKIKDDYLIDGGILNQNPFSILPPSITHHIIVNVSHLEKLQAESFTIKELFSHSLRLMQQEITTLKLKNLPTDSYIILEPKVARYSIIERNKYFKDIIRKGERSAKEKLPELQNFLKIN